MEEMKTVATTSEDISKNSLISLKKVFPNFVKDNLIDFDSLKAFFDKEGIVAGEEKYGLNWSGKSRAIQAVRIPSIGTLTPQPKDSLNWDKTENLFIEGDNLEVLKLLQKHYREKIKMIYIDPPYNTGKDFIYKDNFKENIADYYERTGQTRNGIKLTTNPESSGRYHSDWLTMMYPRLFLAKNLLKDDGVIFISIDDNEVHNLRLIMDEIFGQENFVLQAPTIMNLKGNQDEFAFAGTHEYTIVYAKNIEKAQFGEFELNEEVLNEEWEKDKKGFYKKGAGLKSTGINAPRAKRPNLFYPIYVNLEKGIISTIRKTEHDIGLLPLTNDKEMSWRWSKDRLESLSDEIIILKNSKEEINLYKKQRPQLGDLPTNKPKSIFYKPEYSSGNGTNEFNELMGVNWGNELRPKPLRLIKDFISLSSGPEDLILDFFAGSGTTAHAVIDLNSQDGGSRKWICVQLPEVTDEKSEARKAGFNTIAEIARERIKLAGKKIGKGDIGFKAFSLQKSNYRRWQVLDEKADENKLKQQMKLVLDKPLVDGYDELSTVYEILLKEGFGLNSQVKQENLDGLSVWVVIDEGKKLVVSFAKSLTKNQIEKLSLKPEDTFVCFDSAIDDTTKVNIIRNLNVKVI